MTIAESQLARTLAFSDDDLVGNRDGYMTKEQRKKLRSRGRRTAIPIFAVDQIFFARQRFSSTLFHDLINLVLIISWLGMGTIVARAMYAPYYADLRKGKVDRISGHIHLNTVKNPRGKILYKLIIRQSVFDLPKEAFQSLEAGKMYSVYFAPNSKTILSAEKLANVYPQHVNLTWIGPKQSPARKNVRHVLDVLYQAFTGTPYSPSFIPLQRTA